jgi:uncharacterized membrane protein
MQPPDDFVERAVEHAPGTTQKLDGRARRSLSRLLHQPLRSIATSAQCDSVRPCHSGRAMMDLYVILKIAHVIGACVLFGTGLGIAFFMWMANRTAEPAIIAVTVGIVVIADTIFTATAVVAQPVTGVALAHMMGIPLLSPWLVSSLALYLFVGACWLPVVWIQIRLRDLAAGARDAGEPLPAQYHRLFQIWFILGWPAFAGVIAIFVLMIAKPPL